MKLSIIIPVFNEEKTVETLIKKVEKVNLKDFEKEIIVVDDGSTDASASVISNIKPKFSNLKFIQHKNNSGKGVAVRTGFKKATGDYIVIQDADLEYDPKQIDMLLEPVRKGQAQIVYGTRLSHLPDFNGEQRTLQFFLHYLGNKFLSLITSILYLQWITDMETCYKLFPKKAVENMLLKSRSFDFEPEITAKFLKRGYKILEIPISTKPREYSEGKKLNALEDGPRALWTLIKYRFTN